MKNDVAIYASANDLRNVETQVRRCKQFARSGYGSAPTHVFVDAPASGMTRPQERRGLAGLLSKCRNREIKAVIVKDADRLSRDLGQMICLTATFKSAGVVVHIADGPERTLVPLNAMISLEKKDRVARKNKTRLGRTGRRSSP
jgi:DNA invertase Pin-like site-specific DNA recombinase